MLTSLFVGLFFTGLGFALASVMNLTDRQRLQRAFTKVDTLQGMVRERDEALEQTSGIVDIATGEIEKLKKDYDRLIELEGALRRALWDECDESDRLRDDIKGLVKEIKKLKKPKAKRVRIKKV